MQPKIVLNDLTKTYNGHVIFDHLTHTFLPGITHIKGANGVGKSTLIQMLAGAIAPDSGSILFHDAPLSQALKKQVGYVPDKNPMYPFITGKTFLNFVAKTKPHHRQSELIEQFAVSAHLNTSFQAMSYGTQKKFFLIAALMGDPHYLLMDEPFNGLDHAAVTTLQTLLTSPASEQVCLVASHGTLPVNCDDVFTLSDAHPHGS